MGLDHWTQDHHPAWPVACRQATRTARAQNTTQMPQIPTFVGFLCSLVSPEAGLEAGVGRGCPMGGWRDVISMRVYSQSSGEGTAELGFKAATTAGMLRTARCLGAAGPKPLGGRGSIFQTPREKPAERRRGPLR